MHLENNCRNSLFIIGHFNPQQNRERGTPKMKNTVLEKDLIVLYGKWLCCLYFTRAGADSVCPTPAVRRGVKGETDHGPGWEGRISERQVFPCSSVGKESACSAGELGSVPGLGRSPGEGNSNPLQHFCLENPTDRGAWRATVHGVARVRT